MIGTTISHYRILELIGEGGMGVVYKARDTRLDRTVAIKVLPPDKLKDPVRRSRFIQEARAASALNHPNIVTIHDIVTEGDIELMVMEFIPGRTLDSMMGGKGLPLRDVLKVAIQIADALDKAHGAGIIHRDLKPGNVMVTPDGLVKVLDFGVAKLTELPGTDAMAATRTVPSAVATDEGTILGTASYMSPEQAEGKPLDARSDIFSFGALLYEMVSGQRAFPGDSRMSTLARILREDPRPLSNLVVNVPSDLEKIVRRCLRKDPGRRFHHMIDVKVALEDLKEDSESGAAAAIAPEPRSHRAMWVAAGALVLFVVFGAYAFFGRESAPIPTAATVAPLTAYPGVETGPTFSPDGNQVAFSWAGPDLSNPDIYIKLVGPGDPLRLTSDPGVDLNPAWSPDGRWIAFVRLLPGARAGYYLIPALGGPERKVGETSSEPYFDSLPAPLVAWSPDSKWLLVEDKTAVNEDFGLFLLSVATGEIRRLTTAVPGGADSGAAVSPDGSRLAFVRQRAWGLSNIALVSLSTDASGALTVQGEPELLPFVEPYNRSPTWTPDGKEIVFSSGLFRSAMNLWRIGTSPGAQPTRMSEAGTDGFNASIWRPDASSGRGARMAYTQMTDDTDIWRVELSDRGTLVGSPVRLLSSSRRDFTGTYSPDGKRIAFFSDRSGRAEIWIANGDGSGVFQLTAQGASTLTAPAWSPDGETIAFSGTESGQQEPFIVRATGGEPRRLGTGLAPYFVAGFSADGQNVYLVAPSASGVPLLKTVPIQGGAAVDASPYDFPLLLKLLSPDRSRAYIASGNEPASVWEVSSTALRSVASYAGPQSIAGARQIVPALFHPQNYKVSNQGVYFMPRIGQDIFAGSSLIQLYRFTTGAIEDIASLNKPPFFGIDVSPDGRWLLYSQIERFDGDLMLVENFR